MADARLRDLERAAALNADARMALWSARERIGLFPACGHRRPVGSRSICWACRGTGEVLVGEVLRSGKSHVVRLERRALPDGGWEDDTWARCNSRLRGPGPIRWGVPTCKRCVDHLGFFGPEQIARGQLRRFGDTSDLLEIPAGSPQIGMFVSEAGE